MTVVRVCLDANLYISYLLNPLRGTPAAVILRAGLRQQFRIVFGAQIIEEVLRNVSTKPYLKSNIPQSEVDELMDLLRESGEFIVPDPVTIPTVWRDPKDNYLLACSAISRTDLLVSGDHDPPDLGEFEGARIVSPAVFAAFLDHSAE